ncbi:MAG TPA: PEP-CTERM sorting domain-containing protein [Acidobacteriaceae bacterium]|jgi:hypothetical protein
MRIRFLVVAAALVVPLSMKAQSYTYTYTGSPYDFSTVDNVDQNPPGTVAAPFTGDSLDGSFEVTGKIDNLSGAKITTGAFSFNDGAETISSNTPGDYFYALISTDASGNLTSYSIGAWDPTNGSDFLEINSSGSPASFGKIYLSPTDVVAAETNTLGSFSGPVATPEPSSLALLGSGIIGMAFQLRRRMSRS